jgi:two-component system, OmpR family, sensor histidine kinase KdpD
MTLALATRYDAIVFERLHASGEHVLAKLEPALMSDRLMVCVSSAIGAPRVIQAGARVAGRLGARWYAVYVETPREKPGHIRPQDHVALERNIVLAAELGATVVRVTADSAADGLVAFAKREGITHVIFGQTARTRWEIMFKGSTLDRFLQEVRDATVQVVPLTGETLAFAGAGPSLRLS